MNELPIDPKDLLYFVGLPGLLGIAAMVASWRGRWGGPVALAGAFLVAFRPIVGSLPGLPPRESVAWLFYIAIGLLVLGLAGSIVRPGRWLSCTVVTLIVAGCAFLLLKFRFAAGWDARDAVLEIGALSLLGLAWCGSLESSAAENAILASLSMVLIGTSIALVLAFSGSLKLGLLAGALTAGCGGMLLVALARGGGVDLTHGTSLVFATLCIGLLICAYYLAEMNPLTGLLLAATPQWVIDARVLAPAHWHPWRRASLRLLILAVPLGMAVSIAAWEFRNAQRGSDEAGYSRLVFIR
ncbi:MAG: hypothetical protein ACREJC_04850 [Tepidisphaeraceae bacterium]